MKPLPEGWWHLSMEDIRQGSDRPDTDDGVSGAVKAPQLDLKEWARLNQLKYGAGSGNLDAAFRKDLNTDEVTASRADKADTKDEPVDSNRETTLRDYTTATTHALKQSGSGGTNLFRTVSPLQPVGSLDFNLYNRGQTKPDDTKKGVTDTKNPDKSGVPSSPADVTASMPGASYYSVPSSPLDVVQSTISGSQSQRPSSDPLAMSSTADATGSRDAQSTTAKPADPFASLALPKPAPLASGSNTATNVSRPVMGQTSVISQGGYLPTGGYSPNAPVPFQPALRRPGGPNANGYYEPKSISDLQFGR